MKTLIMDIGNNPDKVIKGTFNGQGIDGGRGNVHFRIKGKNFVVTKIDVSFITILKNDVKNTYAKKL